MIRCAERNSNLKKLVSDRLNCSLRCAKSYGDLRGISPKIGALNSNQFIHAPADLVDRFYVRPLRKSFISEQHRNCQDAYAFKKLMHNVIHGINASFPKKCNPMPHFEVVTINTRASFSLVYVLRFLTSSCASAAFIVSSRLVLVRAI